MQVSLWVLFGIIQLYTNYNFVVQDRVSVLRTKKENIKKFTTGCKDGLYMVSPYDEEKAIKEIVENKPIVSLNDSFERVEINQDLVDSVLQQQKESV